MIDDDIWFKNFLSPSLHRKAGINYLLTFATLPHTQVFKHNLRTLLFSVAYTDFRCYRTAF